MLKIIITKGLPASGKTTWARTLVSTNYNWKRINKDDIRAMLDSGKWSKSNEKFVIKMRDLSIQSAIAEGYNVVIDDTNLHPKHEMHIREMFKGDPNVEVTVKDSFLEVSLQECIKRDANRQNPVGRKVIIGMYNKFLKKDAPQKVQNNGLPHAIICDIDGTIATHNGERSPYDWGKVINDKPKENIINLVKILGQKYHIIFVSGRDMMCRADTLKWLMNNGLTEFNFSLLMRNQNDNRPDYIVKKELFNEYIEDVFFVEFVLDDRDQVVDMWRSMGLTCLQVDYGDF